MNSTNQKNATKRAGNRSGSSGFTLLELLVVIAVIGLLTVMLLPALSSAKTDTRANGCLANERRLIQGWRMYADDSSDILAPNDYPSLTSYSTASASLRAQLFNWVTGTMHDAFDASSTTILTNPAASALANYVKNPVVYHCPADQYQNTLAGGKVNVRSYSMNNAVGTIWYSRLSGGTTMPVGSPAAGGWLPGTAFNVNQTAWLTYGKISSFNRPGPANTFVIMDENPVSINDAMLNVSAFATSGNTFIIDYPSGNHDGAAGISFADGHVIMHKWQDSRTYSAAVAGPVHASPDDSDCFYLAPLTSAPR